MPIADISGVTDFESFEGVYDQLVEVIAAELTDDHKYPDPATGELRSMLHYSDGSRRIGEEPKADSGYLAFRFLEDGMVEVTRSERSVPDAWATIHTVDRAMAKAISKPIIAAAKEFARKSPGDDQAASQRAETVRLFRLINEEWADELAERGYFKPVRRD